VRKVIIGELCQGRLITSARFRKLLLAPGTRPELVVGGGVAADSFQCLFRLAAAAVQVAGARYAMPRSM